jgi:hypothetical protein
VKVSKITYIKKAVDAIVMNEPSDAIVFQELYASGKSGILRGIPAKPRKCIGKKQTFTPMKVDQK